MTSYDFVSVALKTTVKRSAKRMSVNAGKVASKSPAPCSAPPTICSPNALLCPAMRQGLVNVVGVPGSCPPAPSSANTSRVTVAVRSNERACKARARAMSASLSRSLTSWPSWAQGDAAQQAVLAALVLPPPLPPLAHLRAASPIVRSGVFRSRYPHADGQAARAVGRETQSRYASCSSSTGPALTKTRTEPGARRAP